jgi:hypothetical protein
LRRPSAAHVCPWQDGRFDRSSLIRQIVTKKRNSVSFTLSDWRRAGWLLGGESARIRRRRGRRVRGRQRRFVGRHRPGGRPLCAGERDGRRRSRVANCKYSCLSVWKHTLRWARRSGSSVRSSPPQLEILISEASETRARLFVQRGPVTRRCIVVRQVVCSLTVCIWVA